MTAAAQHGTRAAYVHGRCRCQDCRRAAADYAREWLQRRREANPRPDGRKVKPVNARHGTRYAYVKLQCRCGRCRRANTAYERRRRQRAARSPLWASRHAVRPFPLQGLEKALRWPRVGRLAIVLEVHPRQLYRWRRSGLTVDQADELAMRGGLHPGDVWPDWWQITVKSGGGAS